MNIDTVLFRVLLRGYLCYGYCQIARAWRPSPLFSRPLFLRFLLVSCFPLSRFPVVPARRLLVLPCRLCLVVALIARTCLCLVRYFLLGSTGLD